MELDFSPLNEKDPKQIASPQTDIPKFHYTLLAILLTILVLLVIGFLLFTLLLTPFIYIYIKRFLIKENVSAIKLSNFAVKNSFTYRHGMTVKINPSKADPNYVQVDIKGVLGAEVGDVFASNIVSGTYKDFSFDIFSTYGGFFRVMKIKLAHKYPHIILDSTANNTPVSRLSHFFSENNRITLEGDFNNYFKVYAKAAAVDTLRILSPDTMQIMVKSGHKNDIEIIEDSLNIISTIKAVDEQEIRYFFTLADALLNKLDRRSTAKNATYDTVSKVT